MNDPRQRLQSLDLEAFWMPLTSNRAFKQAPRLVVGAKDMYYTAADGRQVMDAMATLWCVNAGHCRPRIVEAIEESRDAAQEAAINASSALRTAGDNFRHPPSWASV